MTHSVSRRGLLASLIALGATATAAAQRVLVPGVGATPQEPEVLSGSDLGFRVERVERDGARVGTLVVRVDGNWVEARFGMTVRRGSAS